MPSQADAVVIGAGALGLSTAYHLASMGLREVVVLDRFAPGSQASPRAAGLFKQIQTDITRTRLAALSIQKVTNFAAETGVDLPVQRSGSILAARTQKYAEIVRAEAAQARAWGVDLALLDSDEAHRLMPYLEAGTTAAACYTPGDVYIEEPASLLMAYLQAGAKLGVTVLGNTPVTGIRVKNGEVVGALTSEGSIATPIVVDAAGAWARQVGSLADAQVIVAPIRHQLYITDPILGVEPTYPILRSIDTAVYIRPARGGLMFGAFEKDPLPLDPRERGSSFSMDDVPLELAVLERLTESIADQVPALHGATVNEHRGGLFTMTSDGQFIVGPQPGIAGLWSATGCNGSGFSLSPGIGQVLAEWIVTGAASMDLSALAPGRFARVHDEDWLREAAVWQYSHYYERDEPPV
ncbi:MAG: putative dehydrogenase protein [Chloroflexi bacterium]|jgi:glycine/D-amino acid oxidase-like deaminating enzyme|nr:putative dehydrogenase protein [Chloroflexota bacterium]